ncbi:MAG: glutathione S-transferase family protein [Alphaproteobacteria bacterium]|uniref:glutathione S-transferase family protein n=1 Tax=Hyphomonas sp. TaxID=87 RepID=UPI001D1B7313|nr:glutathione S-transferase family protein [Alphaproteobacteria bacterium]MBU2082450.1 glutathione S-transferase family protein [Alphaproteobacteria bacterium]MBU2141461.1 glutathione S-transferase family protein [Alphaproteobacteria bacterium]MBU2197909.1 glutathione S-transferase family protein [Alphaproteobacteria bacterium]
MKRLYQWPLDPAGRLVRLVLAEKGEAFELFDSTPWAPHPDVAALAYGAVAPALVETLPSGRLFACGTRAICEQMEEIKPTPALLPTDQNERAEARRLWAWVEAGCEEVTDKLLTERVMQWVRRDRQPDSEKLRRGAHALRGRLTFLNGMVEMNGYLAGRTLSLADLCAAAHLSSYDYFGDVEWNAVPDLKTWYARIKSRPSFRPLLTDRIEGTRPVSHYADLDF